MNKIAVIILKFEKCGSTAKQMILGNQDYPGNSYNVHSSTPQTCGSPVQFFSSSMTSYFTL